MKFCAASPTMKMKTSVSSAPMPGRLKPSRRSGCQAPGSRFRVWSIVPITSPSTQRVIASGTRTSSPVRKYVLSVTFLVAFGVFAIIDKT